MHLCFPDQLCHLQGCILGLGACPHPPLHVSCREDSLHDCQILIRGHTFAFSAVDALPLQYTHRADKRMGLHVCGVVDLCPQLQTP